MKIYCRILHNYWDINVHNFLALNVSKYFIPPPLKKSLTTDFFVQTKGNNALP